LLTWEYHDLVSGFDEESGDYVTGLDEETVRLVKTFESYGYTVHDVHVPMHGSSEVVKKKVKRFLAHARDDVLLIMYYHGHGGLDEKGELVFSR
jgi:hypothetical protein